MPPFVTVEWSDVMRQLQQKEAVRKELERSAGG